MTDLELSLEDIIEFSQEYINPTLQSHGGYIEVVGYGDDNSILNIRMGGGCHGCASAKLTMLNMISASILEEFPDISYVNDVTDHNMGDSPYHK
jgi:Fe-S cluster biogenesis protein NfuA